MTDIPKKVARLQHVVARNISTGGPAQFDELVVFGQKVDALEHIYKTPGDWVYAAVPHGQSFTEVLKAATS